MRLLTTVVFSVAVLVAAVAIGCSGPSSPAEPSEPAPSSASVTPTAAAGERATDPVEVPGPGFSGPAVIGFPPRNEPNEFFQALTALYRDVLRRPQTSSTYVDAEGENVWLTEYLRFYLNGCSHQDAVSRTLSEITAGGTQSVCGAETPTFPPRNLPNEFQGQLENTYRNTLRRPQILSYVDSEGANVWLAQYLRFRVSGCTHSVAQEKVFTEIRGGGVQADCGGLAPWQSETVNLRYTGGSTTRYTECEGMLTKPGATWVRLYFSTLAVTSASLRFSLTASNGLSMASVKGPVTLADYLSEAGQGNVAGTGLSGTGGTLNATVVRVDFKGTSSGAARYTWRCSYNTIAEDRSVPQWFLPWPLPDGGAAGRSSAVPGY